MTATLRPTKITFKAGSKPGATALEITPGSVVVFVGPNNGGKSLALREIERWSSGEDLQLLVLQSIVLDLPTDAATCENLVRQFETAAPPNQTLPPGHIWIGQHTFRSEQPVRYQQVSLPSLSSNVGNEPQLRAQVVALYVARLDGRTRFTLTDDKPTGDLLQHPQNHLWALFVNDEARERVRQLTEDAFGLHFVVDPTPMQRFRVRMSTRPPATKAEEQGLDETARVFHAAATPVTELSDGVQAFVGLVSAVLSLPHRILLIDEPEAFLHPPLARRLGSNLTSLVKERGATLFTATHSADFLLGCLRAANDTVVVRLTYANGVGTARSLSAGDISEIMRDPLLRSTGALAGLFHEACVVTESDSDRVFYDEINRRLNVEERGIRDALFLNAQNRQTIRRLVSPLRRVGIPAAAIVDLDVLQETGAGWQYLLDACQIRVGNRAQLEAERAWLLGALDAVGSGSRGLPAIKDGGLTLLNSLDRQRAQAFLDRLAEYGLFVLPVGECESWLSGLGAGGHGTEWVMDLFGRIGSAQTDLDYLPPGGDDVWAFLDEVAAWVADPQRLGTD